MMHKAWSSTEEVRYCFSRSYVKLQGHTAKKIVDFDPNWAFPDCNSSLNSPMAMKCCTKLETAKERCPFVFQGDPSNFKVTRYKTSPILTQIGRFRTIGRSQLSNPSDLPCCSIFPLFPQDFSIVFSIIQNGQPDVWNRKGYDRIGECEVLLITCGDSTVLWVLVMTLEKNIINTQGANAVFFLNISFTLDLYNDNINVDIWVWLQTDKWFMFSFNNIKYQLILRICDTNISQCDIRLRQMPRGLNWL